MQSMLKWFKVAIIATPYNSFMGTLGQLVTAAATSILTPLIQESFYSEIISENGCRKYLILQKSWPLQILRNVQV